jgi:hypothetical protein
MQNVVIIIGLAILGGFLLLGAFGNSSTGFGDLVIEEIHFREATRGPDLDEWVTVANRTGAPVDLTGWKVESAVKGTSPPSIGQSYFFPNGCILPAGGKIYIHSGPIATAPGQQSTPCNQQRIDLYPRLRGPEGAPEGWWDGAADDVGDTVWANEGDTAWLLKFTPGTGTLFQYERVDTCTYNGNEANGIKKCR